MFNERLAIRGDPCPVTVIKAVYINRLPETVHPDLCCDEGQQLAAYLKRHLPPLTLASLAAAIQPVGV
jgi:hypothetical protein